MSNWADRILSPQETPKKEEKPKSNWADRIFEDPSQADIRLVSTDKGVEQFHSGKPIAGAKTTTGEPIKSVPRLTEPASFKTEVFAQLQDNPEAMINEYAKARGLSPDKYRMIGDQVVFVGEDGALHFETKQNFLGRLKSAVAGTITHLPEAVLATALVPTGPAGVALGGAGGEGIRQTVSHLVSGESPSLYQRGKKMAIAGGTAYVGEKVGGTLIKGHDITKGREGARLIKVAGRGVKRIDAKQIKNIEKIAKKWNIDLWAPQTTKSRELIDRFNLLADLPGTADKLELARIKQATHVHKAVKKYLDSFAPRTTTPGEAGRRAVEASQAAVKAPKTAAQAASRRLYEEARHVRGVDISETVTKIDDLLIGAPKGGAEAKSLNRIKNMVTQKAKDSKGKEIIVPEDRVSVIDKVKKEINGMWKKDPKTSPDVDAQRSINEVLDGMLKQVDEQVPVYAEARKAYRQKITDLGYEELKKTKVGQLAKLEGDKVEDAARQILNPRKSSPESVFIAKEAIVQNGGKDAWDALLRVHLSNIFDDVISTGTKNIGGQFKKKLITNVRQREILQAAMSKQQYRDTVGLMEVLHRTGLTSGKESATASRLVSQERMTRESRGVIGKVQRFVGHPMVTPKRTVYEWREQLRTEKYQEKLAEALLSGKASKEIQSMLNLTPGQRTLIKQLSVFLTSVGANFYREMPEKGKVEKKANKGPQQKTQLGYLQ